MSIKRKIMSLHKRAGHLLYATLALVLFAICGQFACDWLGTHQGGWLQLLMILLVFLEASVLYCIAVKLAGTAKITHILAWIIGVLACLYMLFLSCLFIFGNPNPVEVYGAGWWIGQVNKLEDEQHLWSLSHWIGHGDPYYKYDDSIVAVPAENETQAMMEPYHAALDERSRAETTYWHYQSDTMLNVLSYLSGRWVWLAYSLIAAAWTMLGARETFRVHKISLKALYLSAWLLLAVIICLPALNGCGLRFSYYGPPFTGFSWAYWEFNLMMVGPPLAIMAFVLLRDGCTD